MMFLINLFSFSSDDALSNRRCSNITKRNENINPRSGTRKDMYVSVRRRNAEFCFPNEKWKI